MTTERVLALGLVATVPFFWWIRPEFVTSSVESCVWALESDQASHFVEELQRFLIFVGAPPPYPRAKELALMVFTFLWSSVFYFLLFGKTHNDQRLRMKERLLEAREEVAELTRQLEEDDKESDETPKKQVRIFMEGAFDLMHYGHMNAFRLGHALGTQLVVGVNSDKTIAECKGAAPVMNDLERQTAVAACRFVAEVVPEVPYVMTQEYLKHIMETYNIDYVVHGDDPVIVDGKDVYAHVKAMGKYRSIARTEGVSTTDIVGRMLLCTKKHHVRKGQSVNRSSSFYTTSSLLKAFSLKARPRGAKQRVVYMDGAWDMFHAGHAQILEKARKLGDYLIVGVYNDSIVNQKYGQNFPIMNLNERVLSVLGCKFVDDVLIDAPWNVSDEMIQSLNICAVARGSNRNSGSRKPASDGYSAPRSADIFHTIESPSILSVSAIVERIQRNRARYEAKYAKKKKKEDDYYNQRYNRSGAKDGEEEEMGKQAAAEGPDKEPLGTPVRRRNPPRKAKTPRN